MKLLKKLASKKGQLSMEMGLLIAAAVLVAVVVAYYYTSKTKQVLEKAGTQANNAASELRTDTDTVSGKLNNSVIATISP